MPGSQPLSSGARNSRSVPDGTAISASGLRSLLATCETSLFAPTPPESVIRSVSRTARRIVAAMTSGGFFLFPPRSAYPSSIDPTSTDGVKSYA